MAHHKSAKKRIVLSAKQNQRNRKNRSKLNTSIKEVVQSDSKEAAEESFKRASSLLDKMTSKGIIHKKNAARKKSHLAKHVNSIN
jgi:small subunit ribosomal protein S20